MATFTWIASTGASLTIRPTVRRVAFGDGYEQRLAFGINTQPEGWSLEFRTWTTPAGVVGKFICEEWSRSVDEPNIETVRATFKQVFDL